MIIDFTNISIDTDSLVDWDFDGIEDDPVEDLIFDSEQDKLDAIADLEAYRDF